MELAKTHRIDELKQLVDVVASADRSRVDGDSARSIDNARNVFSGLVQLSSLASFVKETVDVVALSPIVYTDYNGVAHLVSYK